MDVSNQLRKIIAKYKDDIELSEILDFSDIVDDPNLLSKEIAKQASIYTYFATLRKNAIDNVEKLQSKLDLFKSKKNKSVIEFLKVDGISHINAKLMESKFNEIYGNNEFVVECTKKLKIWKDRKEGLDIIIKSIEMRESSFKSIAYMMSSLVKTGVFYPTSKQSKV